MRRSHGCWGPQEGTGCLGAGAQAQRVPKAGWALLLLGREGAHHTPLPLLLPSAALIQALPRPRRSASGLLGTSLSPVGTHTEL